MSAKPLLKSASQLLISEFDKRGISLKPTISYQLISAAFGFWSHESSVGYEIPFESYNRNHYLGAKPQFHPDLLRERIERLLEVEEEKASFLASLIFDLLTHHLQIRIQALRVLYDPEYDQTREMIFRVMMPKSRTKTTSACVAVATHALPALPAQTFTGHLALMRTELISIGGRRITVDEYIRRKPTWIWSYPSPFIVEAFHSLADAAFHVPCEEDKWVVGDVTHQTELGVGFVLLQEAAQDEPWPCYSIVSCRYLLKADLPFPKWSNVQVKAQTRVDVSDHRNKSISETLGHAVQLLPLLSACPTCQFLQAQTSNGKSVIACQCPQGLGKLQTT